MWWGVRIWQIVLAAIAFPFLVAIGVIAWQGSQANNFQSQGITPRVIQQRAVQPSQGLTPARNLVGTWQGTAQYIFHQTDISYCLIKFDVVLTIASQTGNNIAGNVVVTWQSAEQHGNFACAQVPQTNDPVNGTISSSSITNLNAGTQGNFTGSFTTDTITLNQPKNGDGDGLNAPLNLLRQ